LLLATPLGLPLELQRKDRRELDLLTFELLGVTSPKRRGELVDRLYRETTQYHREQRVQDIQSTINRATGTAREVSQLDLALEAWRELDAEWQTPLAQWLEENAAKAKVVTLPEGVVRLPDSQNFFDATTVFFGQKPAAVVNHVCSSRAEAELIFAVAREGLRGPVTVPATEEDCTRTRVQLEKRLAEARRVFEDLAAERAGTDKLREQVADLLYKWFINGRDAGETSQPVIAQRFAVELTQREP
jgi:hypothetical protein